MPRKITKTITIRLDVEDLRALERAEADGVSPSELVGRGLRMVAPAYYAGRRRPPKTRLFVCTDPHLGEEAELFKAVRD